MGKILIQNYDFFKKRIDNLIIHKQTLQYVSCASYEESICFSVFRLVSTACSFYCSSYDDKCISANARPSVF